MSEIINPTEHSTASIFLINAMAKAVAPGGLFEHFKIPTNSGQPVEVEVELKINGVEVPFKETLNEMWDRMRSRYKEDILEKAHELISQSRFEKLNDLLADAEYNIKAELQELFGKE
jgi:hypothetical protein